MKITVEEYMTYRLNFVLWRVRQVMQLLVLYFLWRAIFSVRGEIFGYTHAMIFSYILGSAVVRAIVFGTTTQEIGGVIHEGKLTNFLLRPLHFFHVYAARDVADKGLNVLFSAVEITILFIFLQPAVFFQLHLGVLILTFVAISIGAVLYFWYSMILGLLGFWTPDVWAPRFLSFVIMDFFAGGLFPLDILPQSLYSILRVLPFSYFLYFPLKIYLGNGGGIEEIWIGIGIGIVWIFLFVTLATYLWRKGLTIYTSHGR